MADSRPISRRKSRSARWPIMAFGLLTMLLAAAWLAGGWMLNRATRALIPQLAGAGSEKLGTLRRIAFKEADLASPAAARWRGISAEILLPAVDGGPRKTMQIEIASATASLRGVLPLCVDIAFEGVRLESRLDIDAPRGLPFSGSEFDTPVHRIDDGRLLLPDVVLGGSPRARIRHELHELMAFARTGSTARPLSMSARLHFTLEHMPASVRLEAIRVQDRTCLRIDRRDLDALSSRYSQPLTMAERELLSGNPLRAPLLLRMKEYAERTARRLSRGDGSYNEDSSRHVLWSYWLTRLFGAQFAEQATDAHEAGSVNTPEESERDRRNNALGREWAQTGRSESQVLASIRSDPRVIRR